MSHSTNTHNQQAIATYGALFIIFALVGLAGGVVASLLTLALSVANFAHQETFTWLPWLLPVAGFVLGLLFERAKLHPYNMDFALEQIDGVNDCPCPKRMGFWAFFGTTITHIFGGSAGREGAAIQSAVSLGDWIWRKLLTLPNDLTRHITNVSLPVRQEVLICAVAAGFAGTFRTPLGATVFAVEMIRPGEIRFRSLAPAAIGAVLGNLVPSMLGIYHERPALLLTSGFSLVLVGKWLAFSIVVAAMAWLFIELTAVIKRSLTKWVSYRPLRLMLGGTVAVIVWQLVDTSLYLGLGTAGIDSALAGEAVPRFAFLIKLVLTAITIGSGFPGGEVTPLFFMGSTLGSSLAGPLGLPLALTTRVGMLAAFGAASNSPLAVTCMSIDLFGLSAVTPWLLLCSLVTYVAVGNRSLYASHSNYKKWLPSMRKRTNQ